MSGRPIKRTLRDDPMCYIRLSREPVPAPFEAARR